MTEPALPKFLIETNQTFIEAVAASGDTTEASSGSPVTKPTSPLETTKAFVEATTSGDVENMAALMTDDFTWCMLPATLGFPVKNKQEYLLHSAELRRIFAWLKVNVNNPLDVVQAGDTVVLHVIGEGALANGTPYSDEYIIISRCEGGRVCSIKEFMDSEKIRSVLQAGDGVGAELAT
ncbi:hypothetical protein C8F04DRAFT_1252543 [Mycena alexandri]|uniref:SnoaL-like domain-containing protein n=1 Tax=Mycena alexandri TaxID=1745969 RepID=A0AAD6TAJ3_9AGAR|nr:hypothetical protein C8F04DRAFT_1252543 [Mycena alexandri]